MRQYLFLALCMPVLLSGCGVGGTHNTNLVLITIDTLRVDFLGVYGFPEPVSPNLDQLARRAIVFDEAYATAPFTGPSHASIMTGQHPSTHGMIYNGHRARNLAIGKQSVTLAEHLGQQGFNTMAVVSGGPVAARFGFGRGFEGFNLVPQLGYDDSGADPARVNRRAGNWLTNWQHRGSRERFFLWVHYFTPHLPFVYRAGVRDSLGIAFAQTVDEQAAASLPNEDVRQAYRAEVFAVDQFVGNLLQRLAELELDDDTIVAVVSDHGEYLQEHGLTSHHDLYDEVLHVPMIIHWRALKETQRRAGLVSTIDLAPTLVDLLGVEAMPTAQGRSLRDRETATRPGPVFAEWRDFHLLGKGKPRPGDFLVSVQEGSHKLIHDVLFPESNRCFDLQADPAEEHNLVGTDSLSPAALAPLLERHLHDDLPRGLAGVGDIRIDDKSREMLRSLGYVR